MKLVKLLNEIIQEVGEGNLRPYDTTSRTETKYGSNIKFKTDSGEKYKVTIDKDPDNYFEENRFDYDISFGTESLEFDRVDYEREVNKGELFRVMATVLGIIKKEIELDKAKNNTIETIFISPTKRSTEDGDKDYSDLRRSNLYQSYIEKNKPKGSTVYVSDNGDIEINLSESRITEIGDASKQPYGPIDTITDDEAERQYGFETESGTIYEVKVVTFYRGPGRPVIARVSFGTIGDEGDISYDTQTGENDIYRIMSTIVSIVKKDLESNHADIIEFSPSKREVKKDSKKAKAGIQVDTDAINNVRTKLYSRYIKGQFSNAKVTQTLDGDIRVILNPTNN